MKKIRYIAILAFALFLQLTSPLSAQIKVEYALTNLQNVTTCSDWVSLGVIRLTETNNDDFFGSPGASSWTFFDLYVQLPAGFEFNPAASATWGVPNSANVTKVNTGTTFIEYIKDSTQAPLASYFNIIVLRGLKVKNTNQKDVLTLSGLEIRVVPGTGPTPAGNLTAWTKYEYGDLPSGRPLVYNLPTIGSPVPGTPTLVVNPGDVVGLKYEVQPFDVDDHEVQERIKGAGWAVGTPVWPTVAAVDCKGYYTTTNLNGKTVTISEAGNTLWDGNGPTYFGSTATTYVYGSWSITGIAPNQKALIPLTFSMSDAGSFNLIATLNAAASAVNPVTSTSFTVAKRPVSWVNPPVLGTPVLNGNGNYWIPIEGNPAATVQDLSGTYLGSEPAAIEVVAGTSTTLPVPLGSTGVYADNTYGFTSPNVLFGNNPQGFELTPAQLSAVPKPVYKGFVYVTTTWNNGVNTGNPIYPDPRYMYDQETIDNSLLPVELTTFTASLRNQAVSLKWSTATETNNYGFEVERSEDGQTWSNIGFVAGNGTTSSQRDYSFTNRLSENDMMRPMLSYRLRQIDRDGTFEYSPVVTVALAPAAQSVKLMQNFPNPFNPSTNISFNLPEAGSVTMTVYNELGMEVARLLDNASFDAGWHTASFNASELPSGVYMYTLQTAAGTSTKTMIVSK